MPSSVSDDVDRDAINKGKVKTGKKTKRTMSPEAKAKIAAAQKKCWAAFHAKKKK